MHGRVTVAVAVSCRAIVSVVVDNCFSSQVI